VLGQIEGGAISMASDLDPAIRSLDLCIPAVVSVMGHLVGAMLAEANRLGFDTKGAQEQVSSGNEVANSLVANNAVCDCVAHGHHHGCSLTIVLSNGTPKRQFSVSNGAEFRVRLIGWVNEVLNLGHRELSHAQETLTRRNLIAEAKTDLGGGHWEATIVVFDQSAEVDEHALSSLRSEISLRLASWTNLGIEHEVEGDCFRERVSGIRVLDVHLCDAVVNLLSCEVLYIGLEA